MLKAEIDKNLAKFKKFIYFDLIWPPMVEIDLQTTKYVHLESASNLQPKKVPHGYTYRETSNFDLHMRIVNL
jgi:hypothetical protein